MVLAMGLQIQMEFPEPLVLDTTKMDQKYCLNRREKIQED